MPESNRHNLIDFIASTVEAMRIRIDTISEQMATKVDLANLRDEMATKEDPDCRRQGYGRHRRRRRDDAAANRRRGGGW